jgi:uncharacterized protein (TIGR02001 family)
MKKTFSLRAVAAAVALASSAAALPGVAQAEVSSDLTVSSMYLWRGQDISNSKPAVSSSINYNHDSGFYAGSWVSSEGVSGSYELDVYLGFAKSFGDFGVDVGVYEYLYPQIAGSMSDSDISEYKVSGSWKDLSLTAYVNTDATNSDDYIYYSVDYSYDKFGFHYGMTDVTTDANDYNDYSVSYAMTDALTWTLSQAEGNAIATNSTMDDPIVMVSYSVPLK